jgi:hypothetical protein
MPSVWTGTVKRGLKAILVLSRPKYKTRRSLWLGSRDISRSVKYTLWVKLED